MAIHHPTPASDPGQRTLDQAFDGLEQELPDRVARGLEWLRSPRSRRVRIPVAVLLIAGGCLWFLPVFGLEWLVLGLMLLAQDVPFLREPVGRAMLWIEHRWVDFRRRRRRRKAAAAAQKHHAQRR
jgi:hypothetical protein